MEETILSWGWDRGGGGGPPPPPPVALPEEDIRH